MARRPDVTGPIIKMKVTLARSDPPIWRRLLVPAHLTLADLHTVLQIAMGWDDGHLHEFNIAKKRYGDPDPLGEVAREDRLTLGDVQRKGVKRFTYTYDFGDDWEHLIVLEDTVPRVADRHYPACIEGARAGPPEDCGGVYGYARLLEARADPNHPEHGDAAEWLGEEFDPEAFSPAAADAVLAARFNRPVAPKRGAASR